MKNTLKILVILVMSILLAVSCKKNENTAVNEENEDSQTGDCADFANNAANLTKYVTVASIIEFPTPEIGFVIGRNPDLDNPQTPTFKTNYSIVQTKDGGDTWELAFQSLPLGEMNVGQMFDPRNNKLLFIDTKTAYAAIDKFPAFLDFETKKVSPVAYNAPNAQLKETLIFFSPSSYNNNYSVGLARERIDGYEHYIYVIDNQTHAIVNMFQVQASDPNYNFYNTENEFEHVLHLDWGVPVSVPYIFSDNSILYGPVYNHLDETQFAFAKFSPTGTPVSMLEIPNKGIPQNKRARGAVSTHTVFGIQKGDEPFYVEFENNMEIKSIYKITKKGTEIKELPKIPKDIASYSDFYQVLKFSDDMQHGVLLGNNQVGELAETNDGGKTWHVNTCINWDKKLVRDVCCPSGTDYFYGITPPEMKPGGVIAKPSIFFKYKPKYKN